MAKYSNTKAKINEKIATNGRQAVTGAILNDVLQMMVDSLGADYQFGGLVQPGSSFTAGEQPVVFLATTPGTYTNFGGLVVADGEVALLVWSGSAWSKQTPDIATRTEVSQLGQKLTTSAVSSSISGKYIDQNGVLQNNAAFFIDTYQVKKGRLYKIHLLYQSGGVQSVVTLYNNSVADANLKKILTKNVDGNVLYTYDVAFVGESDNDILAVQQYFVSDAYKSFAFVQEFQMPLDEIGELNTEINALDVALVKIDKEVFKGNIVLESIVDDSFMKTDEIIRTDFPTFCIKWYKALGDCSLIFNGTKQGSGVLYLSIWNSDKTQCISHIVEAPDSQEFIPYSADISVEEGQFICLSEIKAYPTTIIGGLSYDVQKLKSQSLDIQVLEKQAQPNFYTTNLPAPSGTLTSPDFSTLAGKTMNAVGDSITYGDNFRTLVATRLGITINNCGVSSSTIAINNTYLQNKSFVERVLGLNGNTPYADADIWMVFGGANDIYYESTIGDIDSISNDTIYGALKSICEYVRQRPNNPKLILCTPYQLKNLDGDFAREIVYAVKAVAKLYACPVIDLYNESGICHANIDSVLRDGVHPSDVGKNVLSSAIASGILRNC